MVQYGKGRIVYRVPRTRTGNGGYVHERPDCHLLKTARVDPEDLLEKPLPSFPDWVDRCPECF